MPARDRWDPVAPPPGRLVRPVRLDPTGLVGPRRGQARGPRWRRTGPGWYVPAAVDGGLPEQRIVEQAVRLPPGGAVSGWAACRLHGAAFFDGLHTDGRTRLPVPPVTNGVRLRGDVSVVAVRDRVEPTQVVRRHGVPVTRVERAVVDAARWASPREAVVALDMAAAAALTSRRRVRAYLDQRPGARDVRVVRRALELADESSRSPNETRMRLIWVLDAALPPPLVNQPVFDLHGRLLGIADLLDVEAGLVGEFDGADHRSAARHSRDVRREDGLRRAGLEVFRVTGPDLAQRALVADRMHAARRRARWEAVSDRGWTTTAPADWAPPVTLDDELDLRDLLRALHGTG